MLHSKEEGTVVDIINDKMVLVDVGGTKFPVYLDQIDFPYFHRFTKKQTPLPPKRTPGEEVGAGVHKKYGADEHGQVNERAQAGKQAEGDKKTAREMRKNDVMSQPERKRREERLFGDPRLQHVDIHDELNAFPHQEQSQQYP